MADCKPAFLHMLNAFTLPDDVALCRSPTRAGILKLLVSEFRTAFTGIEYEIDTQTRIVNAQAFGQGGKRFVRVYGGLAFHPLVSEDALVFTLLHETGHHRARGRRFAGDPMIACDCLADKWAVGAGANALRRGSGRAINLANALDSLDALVGSMGDRARQSPAVPVTRSHQLQLCWARYWRSRKSRLNAGNAPLPAGPCYYQSQMRKGRKKWVH
jgi:hypothetical protein